MRVWVPIDAAARALGADEVAEALGREFTVTRNGTRGMIWLEPLVEVEREGVRARDLTGRGHLVGLVAARREPHPPLIDALWRTADSIETFDQ